MARNKQLPREFYTIKDAAQKMGVSVEGMRRWARSDLIPAYRLPGARLMLIPAAWVEAQQRDTLEQWIALMVERGLLPAPAAADGPGSRDDDAA
jgi:excisionase family DNA binding protein